MSNTTINTNGRMHRKTLSTQIDRLDGILDGLSEALSESVAVAVKEAVSTVVREAVEAAVKEVLSSPDLLKAALAQHTPPVVQAQPTAPKTKHRSLWESLKNGWNWLREQTTEKAGQVKKGLGVAWTWCLEKLGQGCHSMNAGWKVWPPACLSLWATCRGPATAVAIPPHLFVCVERRHGLGYRQLPCRTGHLCHLVRAGWCRVCLWRA